MSLYYVYVPWYIIAICELVNRIVSKFTYSLALLLNIYSRFFNENVYDQ